MKFDPLRSLSLIVDEEDAASGVDPSDLPAPEQRRRGFRKLRAIIVAKIQEAKAAGYDGEEALNQVADMTIKRLDDLIAPPNPLAEMATDVGLAFFRMFLHAIIQHVFDELKATGEV